MLNKSNSYNKDYEVQDGLFKEINAKFSDNKLSELNSMITEFEEINNVQNSRMNKDNTMLSYSFGFELENQEDEDGILNILDRETNIGLNTVVPNRKRLVKLIIHLFLKHKINKTVIHSYDELISFISKTDNWQIEYTGLILDILYRFNLTNLPINNTENKSGLIFQMEDAETIRTIKLNEIESKVLKDKSKIDLYLNKISSLHNLINEKVFVVNRLDGSQNYCKVIDDYGYTYNLVNEDINKVLYKIKINRWNTDDFDKLDIYSVLPEDKYAEIRYTQIFELLTKERPNDIDHFLEVIKYITEKHNNSRRSELREQILLMTNGIYLKEVLPALFEMIARKMDLNEATIIISKDVLQSKVIELIDIAKKINFIENELPVTADIYKIELVEEYDKLNIEFKNKIELAKNDLKDIIPALARLLDLD